MVLTLFHACIYCLFQVQELCLLFILEHEMQWFMNSSHWECSECTKDKCIVLLEKSKVKKKKKNTKPPKNCPCSWLWFRPKSVDFFCKDSKYYSFVCQMVSDITTQLCHYSVRQMQKCGNQWVCLHSNRTLFWTLKSEFYGIFTHHKITSFS